MKFKIGDIVRDKDEVKGLLYQITGFDIDSKRLSIKTISLPENYSGYIKLGRIYSDIADDYILIKRIHKGKGYQPDWL